MSPLHMVPMLRHGKHLALSQSSLPLFVSKWSPSIIEQKEKHLLMASECGTKGQRKLMNKSRIRLMSKTRGDKSRLEVLQFYHNTIFH